MSLIIKENKTAANYRKQGLEYFKRGGRLYYTSTQRENFLTGHKYVYGN